MMATFVTGFIVTLQSITGTSHVPLSITNPINKTHTTQ